MTSSFSVIENEALQDKWNTRQQEWVLKSLLWMAKFGLSVTAVCPLSMISNVGCSKWKIRKCMELSEIREYVLRHGIVQLDFRLQKSRVVWNRSKLPFPFCFHFLYFLLSMPFIFFCRHLFTFLLFIDLHPAFLSSIRCPSLHFVVSFFLQFVTFLLFIHYYALCPSFGRFVWVRPLVVAVKYVNELHQRRAITTYK